MSIHLSRDPGRAGLPLERWPVPLRLDWERATQRRRTPFRSEGAVRQSNDTLRKSEKGLRRWLGFLDRLGLVGSLGSFLDVLTPELVEQFFVHLNECGNSGHSIVGRFEELELAFRLMYPSKSFKWLTKPEGVPLHQCLSMATRPRFVPSSVELLEWADELFQAGIQKKDRQVRWALVRDALMIAILTTRAPRLHALWSMQLGTHIVRGSDGWLVGQTPTVTKTGNSIDFPLSPAVGVMADRYVAVERAEMLRGKHHDAFWISWYGRPMAKTTISAKLSSRSLEHFGVGFGPHRFRTSLTTTLAYESPAAAFDASAILGHGPEVSLANYNKAKGLAAAHRHNDRIQALRDATRELADKAFR